MAGPKSLRDIIGDEPHLRDVLKRAAQMDNLLRLVRGLVDPALSPHIVLVNLRQRTLVVVVDSSAWAARARYAGRELIDALSEKQIAVERVYIKVRPPIKTGTV
ncbi:MAG: DUF721 domain-containing protein [Gammaproteobacteria bacterium]